jgi:hypothetical protein
MTLDPENRYLKGPVVGVGIQFFRDNFSRFSSLVRDGLCFRITRRGSKKPIYARRHTKYRDPLDGVIERWRERVVATALAERQEERLHRIEELSLGGANRVEELQQEIQRLSKGLARMAIGHRPFEEGELPDGGYAATDTDSRQ